MAAGKGKLVIGLVFRTVLRVILIVAAVSILSSAARYAYNVGYAVFTTGAMEAEPGEDVVVTIGEHMTSREVGEMLESKGLIKDSLVFVIQAKVYEYKPLPGTYLLNTSQTLDRMMEIMTITPETDS